MNLELDQRREREHREREVLYTANRRFNYERQVEFEAVLARLPARELQGKRVLDAGCGAGLITRALARRGARVVALDFAFARLRFLQRQLGAGEIVLPAQADLLRLPLPPASFDVVVCTQVLEHLPLAEARQALLASLIRLLVPGGRLLLTVYNFSRRWQCSGQPREGVHASGIFYHCYQPDELARELAALELLELCGLVHLWPRTYRLLPRLGPLGRAVDHLAERRPAFSRRWGNLLLARAQRPAQPS